MLAPAPIHVHTWAPGPLHLHTCPRFDRQPPHPPSFLSALDQPRAPTRSPRCGPPPSSPAFRALLAAPCAPAVRGSLHSPARWPLASAVQLALRPGAPRRLPPAPGRGSWVGPPRRHRRRFPSRGAASQRREGGSASVLAPSRPWAAPPPRRPWVV